MVLTSWLGVTLVQEKKRDRFLLIHFQQKVMSVQDTVCSTKCPSEIAGRLCFALISKQCTVQYRSRLCRADEKTNKRKE